MPVKKSNRSKKSHKMHVPKKLAKVKPLATEYSLLAAGMSTPPPAATTNTIHGNSFSQGITSPPSAGNPSSVSIPNTAVKVDTLVKP
ncbi:MAG: hypothetical protein WBX16_20885 [Candidatus Acidiferrales bacterium]